MKLKARIDALEQRTPDVKQWHRLIVRVGETVEDARAAYEAENGPIGDDDCFIVRLIAPARCGDDGAVQL